MGERHDPYYHGNDAGSVDHRLTGSGLRYTHGQPGGSPSRNEIRRANAIRGAARESMGHTRPGRGNGERRISSPVDAATSGPGPPVSGPIRRASRPPRRSARISRRSPLAASWPLARDFATYTVGDVHYDERHAIWVLWYTAQALAGRVSWPDTTHLPWAARHLGAGRRRRAAQRRARAPVLAVGRRPRPSTASRWPASRLTGWCLYALARGVGLGRGPAFLAGALYLLWPIHLIALTGHLEKLFVGMLPLTLPGRPARRRSRPATAPGCWRRASALLGALLQNGNQFVFAALGLGVRRASRPCWRRRRRHAGSGLRRLASAAVVRSWPARPAAAGDRPRDARPDAARSPLGDQTLVLLAGRAGPRPARPAPALRRRGSTPATCT